MAAAEAAAQQAEAWKSCSQETGGQLEEALGAQARGTGPSTRPDHSAPAASLHHPKARCRELRGFAFAGPPPQGPSRFALARQAGGDAAGGPEEGGGAGDRHAAPRPSRAPHPLLLPPPPPPHLHPHQPPPPTSTTTFLLGRIGFALHRRGRAPRARPVPGLGAARGDWRRLDGDACAPRRRYQALTTPLQPRTPLATHPHSPSSPSPLLPPS